MERARSSHEESPPLLEVSTLTASPTFPCNKITIPSNADFIVLSHRERTTLHEKDLHFFGKDRNSSKRGAALSAAAIRKRAYRSNENNRRRERERSNARERSRRRNETEEEKEERREKRNKRRAQKMALKARQESLSLRTNVGDACVYRYEVQTHTVKTVVNNHRHVLVPVLSSDQLDNQRQGVLLKVEKDSKQLAPSQDDR